MKARLRDRWWGTVGAVVAVVWLLGAVAIATEVFDVEPTRGNRWVVFLIWSAPIVVLLAVGLVVEELLLRRRKGSLVPGRHSRPH